MQRIGKGRRRIRKVSKKTEGGVSGLLDGVTPRFRCARPSWPEDRIRRLNGSEL